MRVFALFITVLGAGLGLGFHGFHGAFRDYLAGEGPAAAAEKAFDDVYGARMDQQSLQHWLQYYQMAVNASDLPATYAQMDLDGDGLSFAELLAEMQRREQVNDPSAMMSSRTAADSRVVGLYVLNCRVLKLMRASSTGKDLVGGKIGSTDRGGVFDLFFRDDTQFTTGDLDWLKGKWKREQVPFTSVDVDYLDPKFPDGVSKKAGTMNTVLLAVGTDGTMVNINGILEDEGSIRFTDDIQGFKGTWGRTASIGYAGGRLAALEQFEVPNGFLIWFGRYKVGVRNNGVSDWRAATEKTKRTSTGSMKDTPRICPDITRVIREKELNVRKKNMGKVRESNLDAPRTTEPPCVYIAAFQAIEADAADLLQDEITQEALDNFLHQYGKGEFTVKDSDTPVERKKNQLLAGAGRTADSTPIGDSNSGSNDDSIAAFKQYWKDVRTKSLDYRVEAWILGCIDGTLSYHYDYDDDGETVEWFIRANK